MKNSINHYFRNFPTVWIEFPLLFGLAYAQKALFEGNQHTKFISGLANADYKYLTDEWLAGITDPFPLFSFILEYQYKLMGLKLGVHGFFWILLFIYAVAAYWLATKLFGSKSNKGNNLIIFTVLWFLVHSIVLREYWIFLFPPGLAKQYLIGNYYQPCCYGVFILLGIALYQYRKFAFSALCFFISAVFHPIYLVSSVILVSLMIILPANEYLWKRRIEFYVIAMTPLMIYGIWSYFLLTSKESSIIQDAHQMLSQFRISHHTDPWEWDPISSSGFFISAFLASWLGRREFIGQLIFYSTILSLITIAAMMIYFNPTFAIAAPWRISVFIAPLSWVVLLFSFSNWISKKMIFQKSVRVRIILLFLYIVFGFWGLKSIINNYEKKTEDKHYKISRYLDGYHKPGNQYLIPPDESNIRLEAGVPVYITWKSHPSKDTELLAWFDRIKKAETVYDSSIYHSRPVLKQLYKEENVSHIIWAEYNGDYPFKEETKLLYEDEFYSLWEIKSFELMNN
ncbi:MAG TPA: DUF6798 domain-containing protein [Cyclobacteriaceae bacterium]